MTAACGATVVHTPHVYLTPRGKRRACDGVPQQRGRSDTQVKTLWGVVAR